MERKYMSSEKEQRKESELTIWWSGSVGGGTNIQSKLAFSDINRNQKLRRSPTSLYAGVATGLLKTPRTQLQKQEKMTQH